MPKQETEEERTAFLDAALRRHGWVQIADSLQGTDFRRKPKQSDIAKFNALCKEYEVDPNSVKDAH